MNLGIKDSLKEVGKNHNSLLVAIFYRRVSKPIAKALYKTPITPNQVTFLSGLCAFVAMFLMTSSNYFLIIIAAILIQLDMILDCVDGNLARLRGVHSKLGSWLDSGIGVLSQVILYFGLAFASVKQIDGELVYLVLSGVLATRFVLNASGTEAEIVFSHRDNVDIGIRRKIAEKIGVDFSSITYSDDIKLLIITIGILVMRPFETLVFLGIIQLLLLVIFWVFTIRTNTAQNKK